MINRRDAQRARCRITKLRCMERPTSLFIRCTARVIRSFEREGSVTYKGIGVALSSVRAGIHLLPLYILTTTPSTSRVLDSSDIRLRRDIKLDDGKTEHVEHEHMPEGLRPEAVAEPNGTGEKVDGLDGMSSDGFDPNEWLNSVSMSAVESDVNDFICADDCDCEPHESTTSLKSRRSSTILEASQTGRNETFKI